MKWSKAEVTSNDLEMFLTPYANILENKII